MITLLSLLFACAHPPTANEQAELEPEAATQAAPAADEVPGVTTELDEDQTAVAEAELEPPPDASERAEHSVHQEQAEEFGGERPRSKSLAACAEGARLSSALNAAALAGGTARVQVVVTLTEGASAPALLQEPLIAGNLVQGWVAADQLCALSATEGIQSIREPIEASPK